MTDGVPEPVEHPEQPLRVARVWRELDDDVDLQDVLADPDRHVT